MRASVLAFTILFSTVAQAQWPQFRGPDGNGLASTDLPVTWAESKNVRWKTPIHGRAWSSPVILDNQIWMTTATPDYTSLRADCEFRMRVVEGSYAAREVIPVGDWLYDGSVRNRLGRLRNHLLARSSHEIESRRDRFGHSG